MPKRKSVTPTDTSPTGAAIPNNEEVALTGIYYYNKKAAIKKLEGELKKDRVILESYIDSCGVETTSGSVLAVLPYADKEVTLKNTLRVSKVLLPEAIDVLTKNGLSACVETVSVVREDVLEALYLSGKVTPEVLQKVYTEKSSYAFSVDVKDAKDHAETKEV